MQKRKRTEKEETMTRVVKHPVKFWSSQGLPSRSCSRRLSRK
jgi:hypothetical protein